MMAVTIDWSAIGVFKITDKGTTWVRKAGEHRLPSSAWDFLNRKGADHEIPSISVLSTNQLSNPRPTGHALVGHTFSDPSDRIQIFHNVDRSGRQNVP
jgi:hypothetical protein